MEMQSGWREAFAPATGSGESGMVARWTKGSHYAKGLIAMLDKRQEQAPRVDDRLAKVVRIIVEQYDGDVKAFVDSIRYRIEVNRNADAASDHGDEAPLHQCPSTTRIIERISRAHYS
jgi:hypothetical protein